MRLTFRLPPPLAAFALCLATTSLAQGLAGFPKNAIAQKTQQGGTQQKATQQGAAASSANGGRAVSISGVALSPDGSTVAWSLRGDSAAALHLSSVAHPGPETEKLVSPAGAADCASGDPVWSPDGQTLAFLSSCAPLEGPQVKGQTQVFLWSKATGAVRQLTHLGGEIQQPQWSSDSREIAFLFVQNASRSAGALDAMKPFAGVIGEDGIEMQRVYAVDLASGQGRWITPANLHVYEFDWSARVGALAFIAADPPGENNWWVAKLYVDQLQPFCPENRVCAVSNTPFVRTGSLKPVLDPATVTGPLHGLQIAVPRWSPNGEHIAFIGGLMSDQGSTGGDLYVIDAPGPQGGRVPVDVTPGLDGSVSYEVWHGNDTIGFIEDRRGRTLFNDYAVSTKAPVPGAPVDLGEVSVSGGPVKDAISISAGGTFAMVKQGFTAPPEVWVGRANHLQQLTHLNDGLQPAARTESVEWTNGPYHVQGWLTFPDHYDPKTTYPLIVSVHGGPSASVTARWGGGGPWAKRGYFELQPNPRGSFGQGEAFTAANRKDFGYGDLTDIEAGMDFIESRYSIDKHREGLTGWSYGGFMTMFAVTQTHRFKAAVAGAGLSDWLSYYGENSIDQWMIPFFGASVYDDPAVYAKSSAITYIKNVTTPTLVIVGDRDGECPAPQSFEFWHALRDLGVKTQLVVYPNEGHGFRDPEHIRDRDERTAKWFADNMPATPQASTASAMK